MRLMLRGLWLLVLGWLAFAWGWLAGLVVRADVRLQRISDRAEIAYLLAKTEQRVRREQGSRHV